MSLVLPTKPIPARIDNAKFMILFGKEKLGKTSALAKLENNLIIDLEDGTAFVDALAVQARTIQDLGSIAQAIRQKNEEVGHFFYKYITIDNATDLEEICLPYAATLYKQQPVAKNWTGTDVRTLPKGAGYYYLRQAVLKVISMFRELTECLILLGHAKDKIVEIEGVEKSERSLDLVGSLSDMVCRKCDALGYMYRKGNEVHITFLGGDDVSKGCRPKHIRNKDIVISRMEDDVLTTYWDEVFIK